MREIQRVIVSALIFSKDGKLLMGRKDPSKGGVYPDTWHIPGGGVDEGRNRDKSDLNAKSVLKLQYTYPLNNGRIPIIRGLVSWNLHSMAMIKR